jgi:L-lysine 2,3-aminomutase
MRAPNLTCDGIPLKSEEDEEAIVLSEFKRICILSLVTETPFSADPNDIPARKVRYVQLSKMEQLSESERQQLEKVSEKFAFRVNDYYLDLINWDDPNDPIRQLVIPRVEELNDWGELDASKSWRTAQIHGHRTASLQ